MFNVFARRSTPSRGRRMLLGGALAGAVACSPLAAAAAPALEIGYLPILPDAQLFIALEDGTFGKDDLPTPKLIQFQSGPALVQALLAGQLDVAYVGIGPALVARAKGAEVKVVATNIVEQVSVVALGGLAPFFTSGDPNTAIARFTKEKGRKPMIASYPKGAVPEAALQYWLRKRLSVDPASVEVVYQGEAQIQQSLLSGAIDAAATLEPGVSAVLARIPDARVVAHGSQMFPKLPGAVLLVREKLIREHPQAVAALVRSHLAATHLLRTDPASAATAVAKYVGGGRLPKDVIEKALRGSVEQFVADPRAIVAATAELQKFQAELGTVEAPPADLVQLFEPRFFVEAANSVGAKPAAAGSR